LPDGADLIVQENDSTTSAIRLTSDGDEGFLQVYRAGVQKVQIRGNGDNYIIDNNFGINQSAPTQQLVVKDATDYHGILVHGNNAPNISFDKGDTQTPEWKVGVSGNTGTSFAISKGTSNDDKLTIASDGNTSIGTTTTNRKLTVTGSSTSQGTIYAYTNEVHTGTDTSAHVSIRSDNASASGDVLHVRGDGSGNLLTIDKSGTEKLVVDSSGNVLIGQDSGDAFNADAMLRLQRAGDRVFQSFKVDADQQASIFFGDVDDDIECGITYEAANQNLIFTTGNNAEAMRIGSSGSVSIGTTTNIGVLGVKQYSQTATTFRLDSFSGSGRWFYLPNGNYGYQGSEKIYANGGRNRNFVNATGTQVGSIQINSGSTAFNTTSDYRLKDNPQPLTGSGEFIDALQPKTWTWNHSDGGTGVGFIAHEAAEAGLGLCVSGEKDEVGLDQVENEQTGEYEEQVVPKYQQVDYSNSELIANMVAELQSLRARIADLENQ
jgi:hypothetical protein